MAAAAVDVPQGTQRPPHAGGGLPPPIEPPEEGDRWDGDDDAQRPQRVCWQTVASFQHPSEAHLARLHLEAAGLRCVLLDELMAATQCLSLAIGGVKLQVPSSQAVTAVELLRQVMPEQVAPVAVYRDSKIGKMVACVVEAATGESNVLSEKELDGGRLAITDTGQESVVARAIAESCFAFGLTEAGRAALARQKCPNCGATTSSATLRRPAKVLRDNDFGRLRHLVSRLNRRLAGRRCRSCRSAF